MLGVYTIGILVVLIFVGLAPALLAWARGIETGISRRGKR